MTANQTERRVGRLALEYAVHEVLARGDLTPQQYEVHVRGNGYAVRIQPEAYSHSITMPMMISRMAAALSNS